jgi:hypothetical protein
MIKIKPEYAVLRRELALANKNTIEVTDGAGSKVFKSNTRVIAQIAKPLEYLENEPNYYLELPTIFSLTLF